jgi:hypothetical protein
MSKATCIEVLNSMPSSGAVNADKNGIKFGWSLDCSLGFNPGTLSGDMEAPSPPGSPRTGSHRALITQIRGLPLSSQWHPPIHLAPAPEKVGDNRRYAQASQITGHHRIDQDPDQREFKSVGDVLRPTDSPTRYSLHCILTMHPFTFIFTWCGCASGRYLTATTLIVASSLPFRSLSKVLMSLWKGRRRLIMFQLLLK